MSAAIPDSHAFPFYQSQLAALLGGASVTGKKMFGATAVRVGGKVLMLSWRDTLVVKIPASQVDKFIAAVQARRFDPGHGHTSPTRAAVLRQCERPVAATRPGCSGMKQP